MPKNAAASSPSQRDISLRLIELARQNMRVLGIEGRRPVRLRTRRRGSPGLVQAGVRLRVIPGISAGIGGLAYAGIPVTHRDVNQSVTFLSGHDRTGLTPSAIDWPGSRSAQVIVMYMAIAMPDIWCWSRRDAPNEPVAVVQRDTRRHEGSGNHAGTAPQDITDSGIGAPSIVCIGRVVDAPVLDWLGQMAGEPVRDEDPLGVRAVSDTG